MAKKKVTSRRSAGRKKTPARKTSATRAHGSVEAAHAELERAREQLQKAEAYYETMKTQAAEQAQQLRDTTLGEAVDRVLDFVQKHPGAGVIGAAALGFFLGRVSKR